jgi:hypothetical protein
VGTSTADSRSQPGTKHRFVPGVRQGGETKTDHGDHSQNRTPPSIYFSSTLRTPPEGATVSNGPAFRSGPPNTMVGFEYDKGSLPVTQTCSVEEGGPAWTTAVLGFDWAVIQPCADHVGAFG